MKPIFQKLLRHGLVQSHRGARRGYTLVRPASAITVRQTLQAIEGPDVFDRCVFSLRHCSEERPCQVHDIWRNVRPQVQAAFERTTLQDLVGGGTLPALSPATSIGPGQAHGARRVVDVRRR